MPRVIDLTQIYSASAPHLPGDQSMTTMPAGKLEQDGYQDFRLDLQEHSGTHLDAPLHFAANGMSVGDLPIDRLFGQLAVIDICDRARQSDGKTSVTPQDLQAWEDAHGEIPDGSIVFMHSGWWRHWSDPDRYLAMGSYKAASFPGWSVEAIEFMLDRRDVNGIGVDTCSIDCSEATDYPVHHAWLGAGKWAVENLANLNAVEPAGCHALVAAPRMAGCTGFPARVTAIAED